MSCFISDDWERSWSNRLKYEYNQRRGSHSDLEASAVHKRSVTDDTQFGFSDKKSVEADTKYIEVLLVADKMFLQARNGTDYEQYLLTAMNMVTWHYLNSQQVHS
jgi:hypothetical protein